MKKINIAIDGYSACGKSTTAKQVAKELNYTYVDSGAMYRAVTLYFIRNYIDPTNPKSVSKALENIQITFKPNPQNGQNETYLNGLNVERDIREMEVSNRVSEISTIAEVRKAMVQQQQKLGRHRGMVMDGRDIGTVVFPDAELKIFMSAEMQVRGERRQKEFLEKGELVNLQDVIDNLEKRDLMDTTRKESPLCKAESALDIDTTHMTFEEQVEEILQIAQSKIIGRQIEDDKALDSKLTAEQ